MQYRGIGQERMFVHQGMNEWIKKKWEIRTTEYFLAVKSDGVLVPANTDEPGSHCARGKETLTKATW